MVAQRDFQRELQEARPKAAYITQTLRELGILHKEIDVERAGMLALVETPDGLHLGDMISLGDLSKKELLRNVRHDLATEVARQALGVTAGGHMKHITEVIPPAKSTVNNWMVEIHFDFDERRYALIGEHIVPDADAPLGWKRVYRLYQAKINRTCDVPGCEEIYEERRETSHGYLVHMCERHRGWDANRLYGCLYPVHQAHGGYILDDVITPHLKLGWEYIKLGTALFTEALATYLSDQSDPTGPKISKLRLQAQSLRMDFERIDHLLEIIENQRREERGK
jgi:hypothetical protein